MRTIVSLILIASVAGFARAQDGGAIPVESIEREPAPALELEAPPAAEAPDPDAPRQIGSQTVEEFRVKTRLTRLKVTPPGGPAYYFEDRIGDGSMDDNSGSIEGDTNMRTWRIGRF